MKNLSIILILTAICFATTYNTYASEKDYQTWVDEYDQKYVYIEGLQEDLFQKFKIKNSKGPKWGQTEIIEETIDDGDIYGIFSNWDDLGEYPTWACPHFSESDFYQAYGSDYWFSWQSVKKVKGSQKTVFYLATLEIEIISELPGKKSCSYPPVEDTYVFLNKMDKDNKPIYLGRLSRKPQ